MILSYLWHPEKNSNQIDEFPLKQKVAYDRMTKAAHLACVSWKACVIFKCGQERSLLWEPVTCRRTDSHRSCFWEARDLGVPANIKGRETEAAFESVCLKVQSCRDLCDPMDCSPPSSSVREILQARILEWVAVPFSRGSSWPRDRTHVSCIAGRFFTVWITREAVSSLLTSFWKRS